MIDWSRVDELRREIGPEEFGEVAGLFLAEVDEAIADLKAEPEADSLADRLHFVKGSALNLGFSELATLCAERETRAKAGAGAEISLHPVFRCFQASRAEFLAETVEVAPST